MLILVIPDRSQEIPGHTTPMLWQQSSAHSDDVPLLTPAIKLRIKIGRETVVGTKRFADMLLIVIVSFACSLVDNLTFSGLY